MLLPARQVFLSRATVLVQDEDTLGVARDGWYQQNIFTYHDFMKFVNMLIQLLHCSVVTSAISTNLPPSFNPARHATHLLVAESGTQRSERFAGTYRVSTLMLGWRVGTAALPFSAQFAR